MLNKSIMRNKVVFFEESIDELEIWMKKKLEQNFHPSRGPCRAKIDIINREKQRKSLSLWCIRNSLNNRQIKVVSCGNLLLKCNF